MDYYSRLSGSLLPSCLTGPTIRLSSASAEEIEDIRQAVLDG